MAQLTRLTKGDAKRILVEYGLEFEALEPLPALGTINSNFRVRASGRDWFLRVNEGKRDEDVNAEGALVARLRKGRLPTPEMMRPKAGGWFARIGDKPVSLFRWVEGQEAAPRPEEPATVAVCGRALGLLHVAGAGLTEKSSPRNHYSLDELQKRVASFAGDPRLSEVAASLERELTRARKRTRTKCGLIHQDLFPDNLLVDEHGALAAVLDLEQATWGPFVYDLMVSVNAWCWDGQTIHAGAYRELVAAYEAVRPLSTEERAALGEEGRFAAARFTITRITDIFLRDDVDPDLRQRKDYLDYVRRLGYWIAA